MATIRNFSQAFNGGEISPAMLGRVSDVKYQTGLSQCKNFLIEPQGPIVRRPGFEFVAKTRQQDKNPRLIPFVFNNDQTLVLEFGGGYIRFYTQGAMLMNQTGSAPLEVATPYSIDDVMDLHYVQSSDVITIVHVNYPPKELRRLGAFSWSLTDINFGSALAAPTGLSVSQTINSSVTNKTDYVREYAVTALNADATDESARSASVSIQCNPYGDGAYNTISWNGVAGASQYRVYRNQGGIWAFIGQTSSTSIRDEAITPDGSITPPIYDTVFNNGDYPGAVSYFEQRRVFAGTKQHPQNIWMTKSGTESDMSYSLPSQATDRIAKRVYAREANRIIHLVPLSQLMLLTQAAEWKITTQNSDAITPESISVSPQSFIGANSVQPIVCNSVMIYAASRGGHLNECGYNWQAGGFVSADICLRAPHLFDNLTVRDIAYSKAPFPIVYSVSSNGKIIAMTYVPEQQVGAFSTIETDGAFESCCVVAEGDEDILYAVVRRTVGGVTVRHIERMHERIFHNLEDGVFLDACGIYEGVAKQDIGGLTWLEGREVGIFADGAVEPNQVVKNGQIHLDYPASKVVVGLPYESDAKTLPISFALQDGSFGTTHRKNVQRIAVRVVDSSGTSAGPSFDKMTEYPARGVEFAGSPPNLITDEIEIEINPRWNADGQVCIRQKYPLPLRIVSMTSVVELA